MSAQPKLLSSFMPNRFLHSQPSHPLSLLFRYQSSGSLSHSPYIIYICIYMCVCVCMCTSTVNAHYIDTGVFSFGLGVDPFEKDSVFTIFELRKTGERLVSFQLSRSFSGFTNLLFNRRNADGLQNTKRNRLRPGKLSPRRPVPSHIVKPPYVGTKQAPGIASGPEIHDQAGIECMRASGGLAAKVLEYAGTLVKPGTKTDEIDEAVHQMIIDNGAYPSPLGYGGFPKSVCTSVNECICHGIPDSRELEDGDIINIDVTVYLNGYHGDTSATYFCGDVDDEAKKLVQVTKECLDKAISICAPGVEIKKIGRTIHDHADKFGYGVVRQFVGHGVGRVFHADPVVLHYRNNDRGRMVLNQTFTIEPMLTLGGIKPVIWDDDWTVVTEDGSLSAQFEHTILITEVGAELMTQC